MLHFFPFIFFILFSLHLCKPYSSAPLSAPKFTGAIVRHRDWHIASAARAADRHIRLLGAVEERQPRQRNPEAILAEILAARRDVLRYGFGHDKTSLVFRFQWAIAALTSSIPRTTAQGTPMEIIHSFMAIWASDSVPFEAFTSIKKQ